MLKLILFLITITISIFPQESDEIMYVKNFSVAKEGGASYSQVEFIRKEFIEEVQRLNKYKLVGPEAEEAIKAEQERIEEEGGASMMCRADECRRRLLRVSSADLLVEGTVGKVGEDINEIKLEIHGRKVISGIDNSEKKEQTLNFYSVKYKIQKDEKDNIRMLTLASKILAKKISGARVTKDEEAQVSGLKPLGRDDLDYLARSAIIPGWGQFQRGNYAKAVLFGGAFLGALIQVNKLNSEYLALEKNYIGNTNLWLFFSLFNNIGAVDLSSIGSEPTPQFLTLQFYDFVERRAPYRNSVLSFNNGIAIFSGVYLLNLLDAYFSSSKYYFDKSEGLSFDLSIIPNRHVHSNREGMINIPSVDHTYSLELNYRF